MAGLADLSFELDYFCDEVREGFFVSETMKHYWAAQLKVLSEIDKICKRHGYKWFADSGTLLGCVRHKGYIPWDDDLDIAMRRDELISFLKYAQNELPTGYVILDAKKNDEYDLPFYRITNSNAINAGAEFLSEFYGCPFVVGVDIFPLDKVHRNLKKEQDRVRRGKYVYETLIGIRGSKFLDAELEKRVLQIEKENHISIERGEGTYRNLLFLFDSISTEANGEDSSEIALIYMWVSTGMWKYDSAYYAESIELPFENTVMSVPCKYHEVLMHAYGDYMDVVRGAAGHRYPVYRELEYIYRERFGKNPTRYNYSKEDSMSQEKRISLEEQQKEILRLMRGIHKQIALIMENGSCENALPFFQSCQNAAASVGTSIEEKFGKGTTPVALLEQYCEKIYSASGDWNMDRKMDLDNAVTEIEQSVDKIYETGEKDILFLPCKVSWWNTMKGPFLEAVADERYIVNVIPIPYFYHDHEKKLGDFRTDVKEFEGLQELEGRLTSFEEYKLEKRHPEIIVIQFPFDGYSGIMGIPELLYTNNLVKYTDELVYIPFANPNPPSSVNDVAYASLLELIEQPAMFNSDRIVVESAELRKYYIRKLVEITGESMKQSWEDKILTELIPK